MSTLGAGAALADIDGDGLPNDVCYVDTVTDQVIVTPAPGTGDRYKPFALNPNLRTPLYARSTMGPMGCLAADLDEDGRTDLLVYYAGRTPILFLSRPANENDLPSAQNFVPVDIIPGGDIWVTGSATLADLDGTGHLDLILANYFADGSDLLNTAGTGRVYLPNSLATADNGGGPRIYRCLPKMEGSERSVGCAEVPDALPQGLMKGWGLAVGTQDLDRDLYPEIYIANDFGPDQLLWNRSTPGHMKFELVKGPLSPLERTQNSLGRDSFKGMGVDFADLNGDGLPDIGVSSISEHELMESHQVFVSTGKLESFARGVAPYEERGEELGLMWSGWAWDIKFDDFNNKGWPDVVQATGFLKGTVSRWPEIQEISIANDLVLPVAKIGWPWLMPGDDVAGNDKNPFYIRTKPNGRYVDIAKQLGFGEDQVSRGIAIADVDGSGRLSMVVANMWGPSTFYRNECAPCGKAVELSVRLPVSPAPDTQTAVLPGYPVKSLHTRPAINASVEVTTQSGKHLVAQVDGGNGHSGKRSPDLHFGLGSETGPVKVEVKWRADGQPRHETFQLPPGWHTVILGSTPIRTGAIEPATLSASAR
jgi:enediyne biosynthesis protein E4